jgi:O-antigen ligase
MKLRKKLLPYKEFLILSPILAVLGFNLAYHVRGLGGLDAYFVGYYINYLDPVLHIVDIGVIFALAGLISFIGVRKLLAVPGTKFFLGLLLVFILIQVLVFRQLIVIYLLLRLILYLITSWFLLGSIRKKYLNHKQMSTVLFWWVLLGSVLQSGIGISQFINRRMLGLSMLGESQINVGGFNTSAVQLPIGYFLRAYGTFPHPNILGGFLVTALVLIISQLSFIKFQLKKYAAVAAIVIIQLGIFVTWSRVAWVISVILMVYWLGSFIRFKQKNLFKYYVGVLVVVAGILTVWALGSSSSVAVAIRSRLITQSGLTDISWRERFELMEKAWKFWKTDPIFGTGLGNFLIRLSEDPIYTSSGIRIIQPVHNIFLLILCETGLIGISISIGIMGLFLKYLIPIRSKMPIFISMAGIVALAGNLDHYLVTLPQGLVLLIFLMPIGTVLWNNRSE